ncbi:MAG TPA: cation transporter [Candidatus Limnocylindrales bacterium]|nr:cation transporter [Candidatus Limnocylindrales bacterium]
MLTVVVSLPAAIVAGSVALAGFGLDSGVEVGAGVVALAALRGNPAANRARHVLLLRLAFVAIAIYLIAQAAYVFLSDDRPEPTAVGIGLLLLTVIVMTLLAIAKRRVSVQLGNAAVAAEARITLIDSADSALVLAALVANAAFGWWWADALGGLALAAYSLWEAFETRS